MITKYGLDVFIVSSLLAVILIIIGIFLVPYSILRYAFFFIGFLLLLFTINFFRDPDRKIPEESNVLVSPADGKVILIKEIYDDSFLKQKAYFISIFMSPIDVHVNRIPIDGKITYLNYFKGLYLIASKDKASSENERNEIGIDSQFGKVLFVQVAGFVARRIVCELQLNQEVKKGERFGMIKFGSRVDVIVPLSATIKCKVGDKTKAGETILAEF
jgi:phosphatidylserine decarboxylase